MILVRSHLTSSIRPMTPALEASMHGAQIMSML
jgi:hypothetical protein